MKSLLILVSSFWAQCATPMIPAVRSPRSFRVGSSRLLALIATKGIVSPKSKYCLTKRADEPVGVIVAGDIVGTDYVSRLVPFLCGVRSSIVAQVVERARVLENV